MKGASVALLLYLENHRSVFEQFTSAFSLFACLFVLSKSRHFVCFGYPFIHMSIVFFPNQSTNMGMVKNIYLYLYIFTHT